MHVVRLIVIGAMLLAPWPASAGETTAPAREAGWLMRAVETDAPRLAAKAAAERRARMQQAPARKNWVNRHPKLTGALIGFTAGFLIGYLPGDDAVFYDFTAEFNGLVLGGIGAGVGTVVGAVLQ